MSTTQEAITELTAEVASNTKASQALTAEVAGKMGAIDRHVEIKKKQVDSFIANANPEKRIVTKIRIEGSSDFFYPVWFRLPDSRFGVGNLTISRHYSENKGTLHATHVGQLLLQLEGNGHSWNGDANFMEIKRFHERYNTLCSHIAFRMYCTFTAGDDAEVKDYQPENQLLSNNPVYSGLYLRGGGLDYIFSSNFNANIKSTIDEAVSFKDERFGKWHVKPIPLTEQVKSEYTLDSFGAGVSS